MEEKYIKEHHASKDPDNNAASKLSPAAEDSLKAARDKKATDTSYSHAIVPGETHPLMDKEFNKKLDKIREEEARKAAEKKKKEEEAKKKEEEAKKKEEGKGEEKKGDEKKEGEEKKEETKEAPPADAALKIKSSKTT